MKALKSLIFCLIVFLGVSSYAKAAPLSLVSRILYVKSGGTSVNCMSWDDACDLQTALTTASSGDEVWVAAGIYKPTTTDPYPRDATFELKSGVAIYGGFPAVGGIWETRNWVANGTTLSGEIGDSGIADNSFHVVTGSGVTATAILDGFTISGGNANGTFSHYNGGGMHNTMYSSPTLTNIIFSTNSAYDSGGGMYNYSYSNPTLINVTFSGNSAYGGGGMANNSSSPTLTNVTFSANPATVGGGMFNYYSGNPTLTNVTFSANLAYIYGGGIYNTDSNPVLNNVTFSGNSAITGGGMYNLYNSKPTLINVTFSANPATDYGGGMYNTDSSNPQLTNVTFAGNSAGVGGGMYNDSSSPTVTNAIFWGNTPADQIFNTGTGSATITYSDIQNWTSGGAGNISSTPLLDFLANNGGFTQTHALLLGSSAIDTAYPASCPTIDQRGYPRPIDGDGNGSAICDMGAFEHGSSVDGFTLTVTVVGNGSVAKIPDKVGYLFGEVVTLTPSADPGWTFSSWSGDASGTTNPLSVTMSRIKSITANFTQDDYTLTVTPIGSGSVIVDPLKTTYHYGDLVILTPTATTGWNFSHWSGDATGTANPLTMSIQGNTNITAHFTRIYKIYLPLILRN